MKKGPPMGRGVWEQRGGGGGGSGGRPTCPTFGRGPYVGSGSWRPTSCSGMSCCSSSRWDGGRSYRYGGCKNA